jgi:hypothetical protein
VLAPEAGQGAFHLPGRATHHRQRPQLLAGGHADLVNDGGKLLGGGGRELLLALLDEPLVARQQLGVPLLGQAGQ